MDIVIYIYNGMTMLDAIGPYEVLRSMEGATVKFVSKKKGRITADSEFVQIHSKFSIKEVDKADILLIPGSTISFIKEMKDKAVLNWINKLHESSIYTTSVCTGSLILAASGLLKDKRASSHWKPIELLKEFGAIPTRERFVEEGKIITAAGVSAGIDMSLHLVGKLKGPNAARAIQLAIEYDPKPPFDSGNYLKADKEIIELAEKSMAEDAKKDISLWDMIKHYKTLTKLKGS